MNTIAADAGTAHYAVEVKLTPDASGAGHGELDRRHGHAARTGFAYVPGSSALDDLATPAPPSAVGNPTIAGRRAELDAPADGRAAPSG